MDNNKNKEIDYWQSHPKIGQIKAYRNSMRVAYSLLGWESTSSID